VELLKHQSNSVKQWISRFWNIPVGLTGATEISSADLTKILANWDIGRIESKKLLWGGANSKWIVKTSTGKYVLHNAGGNLEYIEFQIFVLNKLNTSDFPYAIPHLLATKDAYWAQYQDHFWLLYRFIEGHPLTAISHLQVEEIGRLMASYHKYTSGINDSHINHFSLTLFETETVNAILQESAKGLIARKAHSQLEELFIKTINPILEAYNSIPTADKEGLKHLEKIPIYNDWHGNNILSINGEIIGLIDFDSLTVAPRIVDVQNGLLYSAGSQAGIDIPRMQAFMQGYSSVWPLSQAELALTRSLMIDRVTSLISNILAERKTKNNRSKDDVLIFLIQVVNWIVNNQEEFIYHLCHEK
jgi:Ser/Thr protein kinase RdoA (MazF antagonist)